MSVMNHGRSLSSLIAGDRPHRQLSNGGEMVREKRTVQANTIVGHGQSHVTWQ